jgi:hypothetical protein
MDSTKLNEYLHITRGNEQMLLNLEAEIDDFLDLLNALRGRGFKFRVIVEQEFYYLKDTVKLAGYTAK